MELNYKELGEGKPLIILHGLFGSLDNWLTLGKKFAETNRVFLVDQRNHGQSPHSDEMSYGLMAADLLNFIRRHELKGATVLGHSMGGKTATVAALKEADAIDKLIIVDMAPKSYPVHHRKILDGLLSLSSDDLKSRSDAEKKLSFYIPEFGVRQFLLKNLYWQTKDQLALRFNLPVLNREIEQLGIWEESNAQFERPALFIRGGKSDYIEANDSKVFRNFPTAIIHTIEKAGHWVHAEAPEEFYTLVMEFLKKE